MRSTSALLGLALLSSLALGPGPAQAQDDSCEYARDNECDEGRYGGTAACVDGTDTTDCLGVALTAKCEFAFDYVCDETRFGGSGVCADGTDTFDCELLAAGRTEDSCAYAEDGECDDPLYDRASGLCRSGSDATDCRTAETHAQAFERLLALLPRDVRDRLGDDSCTFAFDNECDDAAFGGTGACDPGTDLTDCRAMAAGGDDTCEYARDNECDEPGIGLDLCPSGSDTTDCAPVAFLRNRSNECATAYNAVCEEPGQGDGTCPALTDTADCIGRGRPVQASDHFFGRDDRFLPDTTQMPWRAIGRLTGPLGDCSGTLVGPRTVLTAAHCLVEDPGSGVVLPATFRTGSGGGTADEAVPVSGIVAPDYAISDRPAGEGNGNDWAIVTLDRDLGLSAGYLRVLVPGDAEFAAIRSGGLVVDQAGYSWDTGENLSGHLSCRVTDSFPDATILHECDTTAGDSGSPILARVEGEVMVLAVDSQFFDASDKNGAFTSGNLAVDARAFAEAVRQANGGDLPPFR